MRQVRLLAVACMFALLLAACGGNDKTPNAGSNSPSPNPSTIKVTDKGTVDITGKATTELELDNDGSEFYFKPTFMKGTAGQIVKVELKNEGSAAHTFTIPSLNIDEELAAGTTKDVSVTLPSSDVAFFCRFHVTSGMWGSFFLGSAPTAQPSALGTGSGKTSSSDGGYGGYQQ